MHSGEDAILVQKRILIWVKQDLTCTSNWLTIDNLAVYKFWT